MLHIPVSAQNRTHRISCKAYIWDHFKIKYKKYHYKFKFMMLQRSIMQYLQREWRIKKNYPRIGKPHLCNPPLYFTSEYCHKYHWRHWKWTACTNESVIHLQAAFLVHKTTLTHSTLLHWLIWAKSSIDLWLKLSHFAVEVIKFVNFGLFLKKNRLYQSNLEQRKNEDILIYLSDG